MVDPMFSILYIQMNKTFYRAHWIGKLAILAGIVGVGSFTSFPAFAEATSQVLAQSSTQSKNLVTLAQESGSFKTLLQAGQAAGLLNTLAGSGPYTVFAPSDAAIAASIPPETLQAALRPENKALLRQILLYHVVPGEVTSSELSTGTVKTLGGGIAVRVTEGKVIVNGSSVVQANIQASNGVAHVINRPLLPEGFQARLSESTAAN